MSLWEDFENYVALILGGEKTPASGRLSQKADIVTPVFLIECKQRTLKSPEHSKAPTIDWFDTVYYQASVVDKTPIVAYRQTFTSIDKERDVFYIPYSNPFISLTDIEYDITKNVIDSNNRVWIAVSIDTLLEISLKLNHALEKENKKTKDSFSKKKSFIATPFTNTKKFVNNGFKKVNPK
jgi:hypothetical protein